VSGLLVITAHPDDEVLIAGGALAARAAAGEPAGVICLTRGEQGPISDPTLATRETLGDTRLKELRAACAQLGAELVRCYRRQDGNLTWSDGSAIAAQLARVIRQRQPDTVITFGEDGLYYHPDHTATYRYTLRALRRLADPPVLQRAVWPRDLMPSLVSALRDRGLPADLWGLDPGDFGVEPCERQGEIVLDVRGQIARKLAALRCHRTQLGPDHGFTSLPPDLAERFLGLERFVPVPVPAPVPTPARA
jgi:N-acetylglucosamine malate deacetylase 2